ncbi:MAG: hypothetical protein VXZ99_19155, partial [Pseudomonadota bacterium]|nr:hypothetical protein [Pseudomonadota bacterium]
IEILDMIEFADRRDHGYSKGHTLKVALSHALVHRPKNLLLDAPTSGLHIAGKRVVPPANTRCPRRRRLCAILQS